MFGQNVAVSFATRPTCINYFVVVVLRISSQPFLSTVTVFVVLLVLIHVGEVREDGAADETERDETAESG